MPITEQKEASYPQESEEAFPWLLELEHPDFDFPYSSDGHIRLTTAQGEWNEDRSWYEFEAQGETWITVPFAIIEPQQNDEEPRGSLAVQNVDQEIGKALDAIEGPINVTLTGVLEGQPSVITSGPWSGFILQNVLIDAIQARGDLTFPSLADRMMPKSWIRQSKYRGAYRALAR